MFPTVYWMPCRAKMRIIPIRQDPHQYVGRAKGSQASAISEDEAHLCNLRYGGVEAREAESIDWPESETAIPSIQLDVHGGVNGAQDFIRRKEIPLRVDDHQVDICSLLELDVKSAHLGQVNAILLGLADLIPRNIKGVGGAAGLAIGNG